MSGSVGLFQYSLRLLPSNPQVVGPVYGSHRLEKTNLEPQWQLSGESDA